MRVSDLLCSCQNQWIGLFDRNPDFTVKFMERDGDKEVLFSLSDLYDSDLYLLELRDCSVLSWWMNSVNSLVILVPEWSNKYVL